MRLIQCISFSVLLCVAAVDHKKPDKQLEIYKSLFSLKRREQIETAERVWAVDDYSKQYKAINFVMDTIFPVLNESMVLIIGSGYSPDSPFPEDQETQEILGKVYENVIFFGDFLLRMPDIAKKIYRKHKEWHPILKWSMRFCNDSKEIFSGPHATQLHLMAQEIGLIPEEPNYVNPFRVQVNTAETKENVKKTKKKDAKKQAAGKSRGPKLRTARHSEL